MDKVLFFLLFLKQIKRMLDAEHRINNKQQSQNTDLVAYCRIICTKHNLFIASTLICNLCAWEIRDSVDEKRNGKKRKENAHFVSIRTYFFAFLLERVIKNDACICIQIC